MNHSLATSVPPIDDDISTGSIGAGIADEIDIGALQLLRFSVPAERDHALPQILRLLVDEVRQSSVNVSGRDAVNSREVAPLVGKRPCQVNTSCFSDVVGGLLLREVGNMARNGGRDDEAAVALLLEVGADRLGTVGGSVEIGVDDMVPVLLGGIEDAAVSRCAGTK
jgi:hypothetical protein